MILPTANAAEATALGAVPVFGATGLAETIKHLLGRPVLLRKPVEPSPSEVRVPVPDLSEVRGQESAKRALEIAAAGGHNLFKSCPKQAHGKGR